MKVLHALNVRSAEDDETQMNCTSSLKKGAFELDKTLSIFKSDSRFIIKRMDVALGQHTEVSR
jgi:hypothetical protein